jgi:hypothetical protein
MNQKINLWIIAILVFSAAAFAVNTQVVIGVEGTVTDITTGQLLKNGYVQLQVTDMSGGIPATNGGLVTPKTDDTGKFNVLVGGGANALNLACGTQYNLAVSVCKDGSSCLDKASVGTYKFTACYGTQDAFNVPGALTVTGISNLGDVNIGTTTTKKLLTVNGDTLLKGNLNVDGVVVLTGGFNFGSSYTTYTNGATNTNSCHSASRCGELTVKCPKGMVMVGFHGWNYGDDGWDSEGSPIFDWEVICAGVNLGIGNY